MKLWKKGAIVGGIWGILSIIIYSYIPPFNLYKKILFTLLGFPTFVALNLNIHFIYVFIGSPIIGIIIGAGIGYLIEYLTFKKSKTEIKENKTGDRI